MVGIVKMSKIMSVSRSISGLEYVEFDPDISIALEYTGFPVNHGTIPRALPVDFDRIPVAKVAPSPNLLNNLSLPVVDPIVKSKLMGAQKIDLGSRVRESKIAMTHLEIKSRVDNASDFVDINDGVESSGTLGFSDSQDHSHDLSESSDMVGTPIECHEIEEFPSQIIDSTNWDRVEPRITPPQGFSVEICCEDEEDSDGEVLECRRKNRVAVTFCEPDTAELTDEDEYEDVDESVTLERPVADKPAKRGVCYNCHRGNRYTEKEACLVCDAKYCKCCIRRVMGSMPEGRKCLGCIGYSISESKFHMLGKCSRMFKRLLSESELERVLWDELSCPANQLPHHIFVNGTRLSLRKLMVLRNCPNPPRDLKPGHYWYDKVSGFWGKEGQKPCQIITPQLDVGDKIRRDASNGDTNVLINGREITKREMWMMKFAGAQCAGNPRFWVDKDGTYVEEGMKVEKGKIWDKRRTKLLCTFLSLPTPESPKPGGQLNHANDGGSSEYTDQRALCKVLLVGNDHSGTSTIYKQARIIYGNPFSEEERQNIKFMIQSNLYGYLARLLEGRELFEEESLLTTRKGHTNEEPGPSANRREILNRNEYTIGPRLKTFSDLLINSLVSGNLDRIFPAATREYAPCVEELWKDAAIQATYSRRDELELPRAASYFLDKAVEIANMDYEPSDTDIMYADGFTSFNGLVSMEFSLDQTSLDGCRDTAEQVFSATQFQLVRVPANSLGANCKWVEIFEDFGVVLFCVSLTGYDEYEVNSSGMLTNKMLESKKLFERIVTRPTFSETNFLLLLNKLDLLEEKIEHRPLTCCQWFQDFNPVLSHHHHNSERNGNNLPPLAERAFHYVAVKFKRLYKSLTGRNLYVCPVTALESDSVESALKYAREIVKWEEENLNSCVNESSCESIDIDNSTYS